MNRFARFRAIAAGLLFCVPLSIASATASSPNSDGGENCRTMLVLRVIDGDTVYGYIDTSDPIIALRAKLRLADIDAPERGGRARCDDERVRGEAARDYIRSLLADAIVKRSRSLVRACDVKQGKYALRRIGRLEVRLDNGWVDVSNQLLKRGLVRPSGKNGKRLPWCA